VGEEVILWSNFLVIISLTLCGRASASVEMVLAGVEYPVPYSESLEEPPSVIEKVLPGNIA